MGTPSIFICYRRVDKAWAGRLERELADRFGSDAVFRDRTIPAGVNWRTHIEEVLGACKVMLVLIGPSWTRPTEPDGANRLWDSEDMVRREIERGLQRSDVPVIPVTIDDTAMPAAAELPPGLVGLCDLQAMPLSDGRWAFDADVLCQRVASIVGVKTPPIVPGTPARMATPAAGAMVAAGSLAAALAWLVTRSLPVRPPAPDATQIWTSDWTHTVLARVSLYGAERGVLWAIVCAVVLAAAYAGTREVRAGAPAGAFIGLSTGALGGAIGGALFIALKDAAGVTSDLALNAIGVAIVGGVLAGRFAVLVGAERSTLRAVGIGGGLVAGALGTMVFAGDPMAAFITQAGVLLVALAAALIAPRPPSMTAPARSAVKL